MILRKAFLAALLALAAVPAFAAPQQQFIVNAQPHTLVNMMNDTTFSPPTTPSWPMGYVIKIFDNLGVSGGANITVSGKCGAGTSTISTNYGTVTLTWTGTCWQ